MPKRKAGALATNEVRRKKTAKKAKEKLSAAAIIAGHDNAAVDGAAPTMNSQVPFPTNKYRTGLPMPTRDESLVGTKLLHLCNEGKGGVKWVELKVAKAQRPTRADNGQSTDGPSLALHSEQGQEGIQLQNEAPQETVRYRSALVSRTEEE